MNCGDIKLCIDRCVAHDVPDCADMIEMLADQLAAIEHDRDNLLNQVVMLREALEFYASPDTAADWEQDHGQTAQAALAATSDLDRLILCEKEPHYLVEDVTENGKNVFNAYRAARRPE